MPSALDDLRKPKGKDALVSLSMFNVRLDRRHDRRALTDDELARLFDAVEHGAVDVGVKRIGTPVPIMGKQPADRLMLYRLALGTGFRVAEIASLTPASFDLDANPPTVTVEAGYSKHRREDVQPIRRDLADLLRPYLASRDPGRPVWRIRSDKTAQILRADLTAAGIAYEDGAGRVADVHALRHTFITRLVKAGVNVTLAICVSLLAVMGITQRFSPSTSDPGVSKRGGWLDFILLPYSAMAIAMLLVLLLLLLRRIVPGGRKALRRLKRYSLKETSEHPAARDGREERDRRGQPGTGEQAECQAPRQRAGKHDFVCHRRGIGQWRPPPSSILSRRASSCPRHGIVLNPIQTRAKFRHASTKPRPTLSTPSPSRGWSSPARLAPPASPTSPPSSCASPGSPCS